MVLTEGKAYRGHIGLGVMMWDIQGLFTRQGRSVWWIIYPTGPFSVMDYWPDRAVQCDGFPRGGGGGVFSMSRYMYWLRGKDPPFSNPMVRQKTPLFQHGPTYDLIFGLVRQITPIFPYMVQNYALFWRLIHVRCRCRVLTPIFSLNVEFWPLYFLWI